ncbi:MAG: EAL domain-containing protein [Bacteroides sp.]|nr:EAL domain-containing protein [Prevotella sp.]MCM1408702.1 EAL domain-containing protein [Treponema brennaborense]MCM1470563.1 EAL domain-containing protein [Bacteroides sp.]
MKRFQKTGLLAPVPMAIRNGFVMVIQILLIGSFACLLENLQIPLYQNFIKTFANGSILKILAFVDNSTLGMLSVYMTLAVSISYVRIERNSKKIASFACSATVLACFFIMIGFFEGNIADGTFNIYMFSGRGMFAALIAAIGGSVLFSLFSRIFHSKKSVYADGTDSVFNSALETLLPALCVIIVFALFNYIIILVFGCSCIQDLFIIALNRIFEGMERSYFSGLLFIFLSQIMWFVGIHGSNLLEQVAAEKFTEITGSIVSKSFIDNFVIMGGCGTTLALLVAIFLFSKRNTTRCLAKISAGPIFFNINELMVFGLPIVYNVYLLVPFILVPIAMYTISYAAVYLGLVEITVRQIHWTTPILLSGFQTTGSLSGSILQLVNLAAAVFIYRPFVLWYDAKTDTSAMQEYNNLVDILKESEAHVTPITLTELKSPAGMLAKSLVNDLRGSIADGSIRLKYQPQYDNTGKCIGAEALLRWMHPRYGVIYPPLAVKLALEGGLLWEFEQFVTESGAAAAAKLCRVFGDHFKLSINITVATFYNPQLIPHITHLLETYGLKKGNLCIEITEEMSLGEGEETNAIFKQLREIGCTLALDDFSMGHTSLQYLQNNQFDLVKIDGSLVKAMMNNSRSRDIIASIVYLSNSLHFDVVAEYVETAEEKEMLEKIGCNIYQGFLFGSADFLDDFIIANG